MLYKYMTAKRAMTVLPEGGNGTLRVTQPAALNDPFECATLCAAVYPSAEEEVKEIMAALNWIVPERRVNKSDVQLSVRQLGTQAWNDLFRKQLSRRFGVVSFSSNALHPLLWAHYADSGAGVVVGYRVSELKEIAKGYERLGAVRYTETLPRHIGHVIFKDEGNLHVTMLTKADYWKYEEEWRLTLELMNMVGMGEDDPKGYSINLCPIPNEAVTEVYVTERTPRETIAELEKRLRNPINRFSARAVRELTLARDGYGYTK